jgi:hypothetical protein
MWTNWVPVPSLTTPDSMPARYYGKQALSASFDHPKHDESYSQKNAKNRPIYNVIGKWKAKINPWMRRAS